MIRAATDDLPNPITILPLRDTLYNEDEWVSSVQGLVSEVISGNGDDGAKVSIVGMDKDASSYYLKSFPQWDFLPAQETDVLSATDLRNYLFEADQTDCHGALLMLSLIHI